MSVSLAQDSRFVEDDRWDWSIWVEGSPDELDAIEYVEYTLHPTFNRPVQRRDDRGDGFRLDASGWGEFMINARIHGVDGSDTRLDHWLRLAYPDETPGTERSVKTSGPHDRRPAVFLSSSFDDEDWHWLLKERLEQRGLTVKSQYDLDPGSYWEADVESAIKSSDAVVAVIRSDASSWVEREARFGRDLGKPVIPVAVGDEASVPRWMAPSAVAAADDAGEVDEVADEIISLLEMPPG